MTRVARVPTSTDDPGYEAARDELVEVVRRLEAGGATLEESLALWERGELLAAVCQRWLDGARARLAATAGTAGTASSSTEGPDGTGPDQSDEAAGSGPHHQESQDAPDDGPDG
jgi:exodeoxyribonuclease VII small subunit